MPCGERSRVCIVCVTGHLIGLQAVKQIDWIESQVHLSLLRLEGQSQFTIHQVRSPVFLANMHPIEAIKGFVLSV